MFNVLLVAGGTFKAICEMQIAYMLAVPPPAIGLVRALSADHVYTTFSVRYFLFEIFFLLEYLMQQ